MGKNMVKVFGRHTIKSGTNMWASLYLRYPEGGAAGWLCDSWAQAGPDTRLLMPKLHWLNRADDRFHTAHIVDFGGQGSVQVGAIDEDIEPHREQFIRTTLADWEREYVTKEGASLT
jgi:hypothetical protein